MDTSKYLDIKLKGRSPLELVEALTTLSSLFSDPTVALEELNIVQGTTREDPDQIFVTYFHLNEEQLNDRKDYVDAAMENYISKLPKPRVITENFLHFAEIYANYSQVRDIDNLNLLLQSLTTHLEGLDSDYSIQEIKFVDHTNEDALREPHFELLAIRNSSK